MKQPWITALTIIILAALVVGPAAAAASVTPRAFLPVVQTGGQAAAQQPVAPVSSQGVAGRQPGEPITFEQAVPINIVLIGFQNRHILRPTLFNILPASYEPVVRYPLFYGQTPRDLGLKFNFNYRLYTPDQAYQDAFFGYLASIGTEDEINAWQQTYNDQQKNVLDITGPVLYIDAAPVEAWLAEQADDLIGERAEKGYTVYFINWFDRSDFRFHLYQKIDEPDPDTGVIHGIFDDFRYLTAWGGSSSRAWFYDLSAGPEAWTGNFIVDYKDFDGNGVEDYRFPPIWEYAFNGYRQPRFLSRDLGLATRFVAINLLFTASPLYDPLITAPGLGGSKVAHIEVLEDDPAEKGLPWVNPTFIQGKLAELEPYYNWQIPVEATDPIDPGAERAFRIWAGLLAEDDCWNYYGDPFAELYCYFDANLGSYVPAYGEEDYVGELFAINTTDANLDGWLGLLGFADDNWVDGTQTYVFEFDTPGYREMGWGFSSTSTHEFGHHIGLSHPHDGYDSTLGFDYSGSDQFLYAWLGDMSDTIMAYMWVTFGFSQFDQDNLQRFEFAGYLNWTNELLALIQAHPDAPSVAHLVAEALAQSAEAVPAFYGWDYPSAATHARLAYDATLEAAEILGIPTPSKPVMPVAPTGASVPRETDPLRIPEWTK